MFSKLANGLAGTWDSLDPQERILVLYLGVCAVVTILSLATQPVRAARKRQEMDALAELVAEKVRRGR